MEVFAYILLIVVLVAFIAGRVSKAKESKNKGRNRFNQVNLNRTVIIPDAKLLFFDTETTGLPDDNDASYTDTNNWPRIVSLSWILEDEARNMISCGSYLIRPEDFSIPKEAEEIHGISTQQALAEGYSLEWVIMAFRKALMQCDYIVGHNISFDMSVIGAEFHRLGFDNPLLTKNKFCTMRSSTKYCAIPHSYYEYKWPKLQELHTILFGYEYSGAHDSISDVKATERCFWELRRTGVL